MGNSQSNLVKKSPKKQKNEIARNDHSTNLTHGSMAKSAALSMTVEDNDPSSQSPVAATVKVSDNQEPDVVSPVITPSVVHAVGFAQRPESNTAPPPSDVRSRTLADLVDPTLSKELETESKKLVNAVIKMIQASPTTSGKQTLEESVKNSPGKKLVDMIDAAANNYSEYEPKLNEALEQFTASIPGVSDVASSLSQGLKSLESIITNVADTHPLLKVAWSLISAGFKMVKNAADLDIKFVELVTTFDNTSGHIRIAMTAKSSGMSAAVTDFVVQGINNCMKCTIQLVQLCLEHDNQNKVARFVFAGSAIDKFKTIKESLDVSALELREKLGTSNFVISADISAKVDVGLAINADTSGKVDAINTMVTQLVKSKNESKEDPLSFISYPVNGSLRLIQKLSTQSTIGTRDWLLDEILEAFSSFEVYCLRSEAGVGKSVISGCLGKRLQDSKLLKAAFFCQNGDAKTTNLVALIQNVAHQLANSNSEFYNALIEAHKAFYRQFKRDPSTVVELLDNYIVIPLSKWAENEPCFVILDALDELSSNSSLDKDIDTLLTTFAASKKVKLFVTTRTNKAKMEQILPNRLTAIIRDFPHENKDKQRNLEDIELFAATQLKSILPKNKLTDGDIATLANFFQEKSNGLFIWAAMALDKEFLSKKYQKVELSARNSIQTRMELLKMELQEIAKLGLYDFYTLAFKKACPLNEDKKDFLAAIGFILHAKVPVSLELVVRLVPEFDGLPNSENPSIEEMIAVRDYVERCSSLLYNDNPDDTLNGKCHFIHKTVREYLSDKKTLFFIDGQSMSVQIAKTYLKRFCGDKFLFKNMANLAVTASESYSGNSLSEELVYGVQYWHRHFIEALSGDCAIQDKKELIRLFVKFCETKLVFYLEAIVLLGKLNDIPRLVIDLTACLREIGVESLFDDSPLAGHEVLSLLNDFKYVAYNFRTQLLVSPLQVYNHALIAVPQETVYYRLYQSLATARITIGAETEWGPFTLVGHSHWVFSVAYSPDGKTVVSGSRDKTVKLWSVETGECVKTLEGHSESVKSVAFSPDSKTVVSGSDDKTVKLWDVETGELRKTLKGHSYDVLSVAFSPDSKTVVSGSWDTTVKLWDVETGELRKTLVGHSLGVNSVAFSPDGKTVVSGSDDDTVKLWDVEKGELRKTLGRHCSQVVSVAFSPDSKTVVSGSSDYTVNLWDVEKGELRKTLGRHSSQVVSVAFSPDSKTVVSGSSDYTVNLWDIETGKLSKTFKGHSNVVNSVAFSPDCKTAVSGSFDETVKLWSAETGELRKTLEGHSDVVNSVAFSPDGKTVVSTSIDNTVKLWSAETGELRKTLGGYSNVVNSVAFSPDGKTVVSTSIDNTVKLWSAETGELRKTLEGHSGVVRSVAFSPDGKTVVSTSIDNTVKLWSAETGELHKTLEGHSSRVTSVAFSPDSKTVVSRLKDNSVKLWDVDKGELRNTLEGHSGVVLSVAFSPDSKTVVSRLKDNTVILWDVDKGEFRNTLVGHSDRVNSVAFSPDSKSVVSGSSDNTVKLWSAETGELRKTLKHSSFVYSVAFSPDSKTVVSRSKDNTVKLWDVDKGECLETRDWYGEDLRSVFSPSELTPEHCWVCQGKKLLYFIGNAIHVFSESSVSWREGKNVYCLVLKN